MQILIKLLNLFLEATEITEARNEEVIEVLVNSVNSLLNTRYYSRAIYINYDEANIFSGAEKAFAKEVNTSFIKIKRIITTPYPARVMYNSDLLHEIEHLKKIVSDFDIIPAVLDGATLKPLP